MEVHTKEDKHRNAPNAGQTKKCTRMTKTEVHKMRTTKTTKTEVHTKEDKVYHKEERHWKCTERTNAQSAPKEDEHKSAPQRGKTL